MTRGLNLHRGIAMLAAGGLRMVGDSFLSS